MAATFVLLVQRNTRFRHYLLAKVQDSIYESSRMRVRAADFRLDLSSMSMDLDNIVVHGTEPAGAEPLLRMELVQIGITVDSVLGRKWHFHEVRVRHPVVHLVADKTGENNLPKPPGKAGSSESGIFDLGVRRLLVERGEIYYNDRKNLIEADVRDVELTAGYEPAETRYRGRISYDRGNIRYGAYAPVAHSLQATFAITPRKITVEHLQAVAGKSSFSGNAALENYSDPAIHARLQANYDATLQTSDLARIFKYPELPAGSVRLTGFLNYENRPNRSLLEAVSLWGMIRIPELAVHTANLQTTARNIAAKYKLENGTAEVQNLRAELLGGTLEGRAVVRDLAGAGQGRLEASLKDVSLSLLQTVSPKNHVREAHLTGTIRADAEASWAKELRNLAARANVTIKGALGQNPAMPLDAVIHADYSHASRRVALHNSYLRTPQTSLTLDGTVSRFSQLQFRFQARDLHEAELLVNNLRPFAQALPRIDLGLHGTARVEGTLSGNLDNLQVRAQLAATNFSVKGSSWKMLRAGLSAGPSQVSLSNGELVAATQGRINFNLQSALQHWTYSASSPITARITASQISLADLDRLANRNDPIAGILAVDIAIHGTQTNPIGRGNMTLENVKFAEETIQHADAQFHGNGEAINVSLHARMPAGRAEGSLTYRPKARSYQARLQASDIRLEKIATLNAHNAQVAGNMNLKMEGEGTLDRPELVATAEIPSLQVRRQTIRDVNFQARLRQGVAEITLDSHVAQTYVKGSGTLGVTKPYQADLRLDTGTIPLQDLLTRYASARAEGFTAQTELHAAVRGPLAEKSRLEVHVEAPVLNASYKQFTFAAARPLRLDYRDGVAVLQPASIQGTGTDIQMEATIPLRNLAAATYQVRGKIDLSVAQLLQPGLESSGQIQFDVDSRRYGAGSDVQGEVRIVDAALHTPAISLGLDHGNGVVAVSRDRLEITNFQGEVGGGTVTASGTVSYGPRIQSTVALTAKAVRLRYPQGLRTVLDSNLRLTGSPRASLLSGRVLIDRISFTPDFDLSRFLAQLGEEGGGTSWQVAQNMKLDLALQSTSEVNLTSNQLSLQGSANMRIAGTAAAPVLLGRANLSGGEMLLAGNRYVVQSGTVDFLNPVRTQPVVGLQVKTVVDQYNITLNIEGPLERLHVNYTSDPALPPADIINLLAFGKTTEAGDVTGGNVGRIGAQSLLAQGIGNVVSTGVAKYAGLPHFSIDPALRGNGQDPGARITVQQRVTSNLFVTYSTDVTSTQRPAIGVDYQFNRKWSLHGTRDQNGGFGVSGRYHKDF